MKKISEKDLSLDKQVVSNLGGPNGINGSTEDNCNQTDNNCPTVPGTCPNTNPQQCTKTLLEECLNQTQEGDNCDDKTKIVECLQHTIKDCPATNSQYFLCCEISEYNTCETECQGHQEESVDFCEATKDSLCDVCSWWETCMVPITETDHC
ncbi:MAG: hypothetical protein IJM66_03215 [Muribaculaceae bacterium]|nr:hypothetical protein [Muribaculaceae bacterium]